MTERLWRQNNRNVVLRTRNANVVELGMPFKYRFLSVVSDPNVAYILMMIGMFGILFEIYSPGAVFPGVLGSMSLILAFYAFQAIPINFAGLGLILLDIIFFVLDDLLSHREKINLHLQEILDRHTEPWGIKVSNVEVKNVDLPQEMQRAIARQAEAERERRAKVISAEGEYQASTRLSEASEILSKNPTALQLRYLATLIEISSDKSSTIIFPIPIDILKAFMPEKKP